MKTFKVLYIDDDKDEELKIDPLVRELSSLDKLEIELEYPTQLEPFVDFLAKEYQHVDALIIDLKLNENHAKKEDYATYPAQILATAVRTYQNGENKKFNEFPIFLISSLEKKVAYYDSDVKSHDLFDYFVSKNDIPEMGQKYERELFSIISAYKVIADNRDMSKLLDIENTFYESLSIDYDSELKLTSTISQFIFKEIVMRNGALIDEDVLAARLGIDREKSQDWESLKEMVSSKFKYNGIFGDVWERWWADGLLEWWESDITSEIGLMNSEASQRVLLIEEKLKLNELKVAEPIEPYMSTSYWTICKALNKPLDIYDGLLLNSKIENWQDKEYVSPTAVFESYSKRKGLKLHPSERERIEEVKALYNKRKYGN